MPVVVASTAMVFLPTAPVSAGYLLLWLIVLYVGWSLLTIAHMSWGAELTPDYNERSRVQGWREVFLIGGMVTALALPALIEQTDPTATGADRMEAMGWYIMLLLPLTVAWAVLTVPEQPVEPAPHLGWRRAMAIVAGNLPLRRLLLMDLIGGLGGGIIAAIFLFVAEDHLQLGTAASGLLLVYFLSGCIFVPVMVRLSYRLGKHRTLAASSLFSAVTLPILFFVPAGNAPVAAAVFALFGINMGAGPFLFRSIMADVADHDRVESGAQRTGLYFALLTMTNKVGHALSIGVVYPLLELIGYTPGAANGPTAVAGLTALAVWPPVICGVLVAVFMWSFPIDIHKQEELRRIIEEGSPVRRPAES